MKRSAPLARRTPLKRTQMKRKRIRRDWTLALAKLNRERCCRYCGKSERQLALIGRRLECAHTIGREYDCLRRPNGEILVEEDATVPLCGPQVDTGTCHQLYDARKLNLLRCLSENEIKWAVSRMGQRAYGRLRGNAHG